MLLVQKLKHETRSYNSSFLGGFQSMSSRSRNVRGDQEPSGELLFVIGIRPARRIPIQLIILARATWLRQVNGWRWCEQKLYHHSDLSESDRIGLLVKLF